MTEREPEWSEEDQGWMLALAEYRSTRCPSGCGQDVRESTDPASEGKYRAVEARCHACTERSIAQERLHKNPQSEALLWRIERR